MTLKRARRIVVVEDDSGIRSLLRHRFEKEGFEVAEAVDAAGLEAAYAKGPVDLITLDIGLEHESGLALMRTIRTKGSAPVIMISGQCEEIDRVLGLELGADDYVTKPFSLREVVARVHAVLRRTDAPAPQSSDVPGRDVLIFQGGALDCLARSYHSASGAPIDLTTMEFNLLAYLMRNAQRVLTRDAIMNALKGHNWAAFDRSVDAAITRLRKKCEPDPGAPRYIKTVRGVGYVFAAKVERRTQ